MKIPDSIKPFVNVFSKLPNIGPRQAIRLAYYLANRKNILSEIINSLQDIQKLKLCPNCFLTHDNQSDLCDICENPARNKSQLAIVEKETDLLSIESTNKYHGVYLCIGNIKKTGKLENDHKNKLDSVKSRSQKMPCGKFEEIIIAFSPTTAGDISSEIITEYIRAYSQKITKLGRGIPIGGEVEFADSDTLNEALSGRK